MLEGKYEMIFSRSLYIIVTFLGVVFIYFIKQQKQSHFYFIRTFKFNKAFTSNKRKKITPTN